MSKLILKAIPANASSTAAEQSLGYIDTMGSTQRVSVKAQPKTVYRLVDAKTGEVIKNQTVLRQGKKLKVMVDGVNAVELDNFFPDEAANATAPVDSPSYLVDTGVAGAHSYGVVTSQTPVEVSANGMSVLWTPGMPAMPLAEPVAFGAPAVAAVSGVGSMGGLAAAVGVAAAVGGGGGGDGSSTGTKTPGPKIKGSIFAGPVVGQGLVAGLKVQAFDDKGNSLGTADVKADGTYELELTNSSYKGALVIKVYDDPNDKITPKYVDEATGQEKTFDTPLLAVVNYTGDAKTAQTVNVTPLTNVAALVAGVSASSVDAFTVSVTTKAIVDGGADTVSTSKISSVAIDGNDVVLTLATAIVKGQKVTVSYTDPDPDPSNSNDLLAVQDVAGNDAATFDAAQTVTNNVTAQTVVITVNPNQSFIYNENQTAKGGFEAQVKTTVSDGVTVSKFRFEATKTSTSSDGWYSIDKHGNISLTSAGLGAGKASNDFETKLSLIYKVQAGDNAGNWSAAEDVILKLTNVNEAPTVSAPAALAVNEDAAGNLQFTGTPFADVDSTNLTVTLSIADGSINATTGGNVTVGGTAIARTFTGTAADLNTFFTTAGKITYTLTQAEVGKAITVVATYTDPQGSGKTVTSSATGNVVDVDDAGSIGSITGTVTQGQTLTAGTVTDPDGTVSGTTYQWKAGGTNISGATGSTYVLTQAEVGKTITVVATYTDPLGSGKTATSSATTNVVDVDDAGSIGTITNSTNAVRGTTSLQKGDTMTAGTVTDPDGGVTGTTYQWKAGGTNISGATNSTYTLTQADEGKAITVVATYTDAQGSGKTVTSIATSNVVDTTPPPVPGAVLASDTGISTDRITNNGTINVTTTGDTASWQYSINSGTTWINGVGNGNSASFVLPEAVYALNQVQVKALDASGNSAVASLAGLTVDTTGPTAVTLALASDTGASNSDGITSNGLINVTTSGADTASWQYSTNSGSTWTNGTGNSFTVLQGTYAPNQIQVKAVDVADNRAITNFGALTVAKSMSEVVSYTLNATYTSSLNLYFDGSNNFDGALWNFSTAPIPLTAKVNGVSRDVTYTVQNYDNKSMDVELGMSPLSLTDLITISYVDPNPGVSNSGDRILKDLAGNESPSFNVYIGGTANNNLVGTTDKDIFFGGTGNDTMTGGGGSNTYNWLSGDAGAANSTNIATDTIKGFSAWNASTSSGDKLNIASLLDHGRYTNLTGSGFFNSILTGETVGGVSNCTVITLDTNGWDTGGPTQKIVLEGVNLLNQAGITVANYDMMVTQLISKGILIA